MNDFLLGDVRLSSGRLEILYNNEWGTVCSDNFDNIDAQVACKQLGYRKGIVLGKMEATVPLRIWLDKLECIGWEHKLIDCSHIDWGNHTCSNDSAVGIRCYEGQGDVRIKSRRLEIHYNGTWGTVCDDDFDDRDATVACKQLGYNSGVSLGETVGYGIGRTWLDNLKCSGNERTLGDCPSSGWGVEDCNHTEDVGIKCLNSSDG
ncbi:Neurotrypsin,Scavenger receptor cysteine-rich type 1 protein M130,Scavenger receptor cysteine-rich type 1 protein M160 [Mytilus coruscus]|uniref:Neurotrypsin,Scavenger receptor cysteine-rich type 1 protein M130,Scavenger receptor cysteine-rich type 1 protein M160 n=1 Tax=Mytilus coruscus TaxID=42192 RepID=A0A6J8EWL3_MYTCO|nr:Neurotrypsin,Scavenger receptor cysteine-rich type 1 protein M130,Scavenger receptor cysteine-rich type 1 protein M160 [Mytilus coruscus]